MRADLDAAQIAEGEAERAIVKTLKHLEEFQGFVEEERAATKNSKNEWQRAANEARAQAMEEAEVCMAVQRFLKKKDFELAAAQLRVQELEKDLGETAERLLSEKLSLEKTVASLETE